MGVRTIYKFPISGLITKCEVGEDYKVVLAGPDGHGESCIWIDFDTDAPKVKRSFYIIGTGMTYNENYRWVASYKSGIYIWHVMEMV